MPVAPYTVQTRPDTKLDLTCRISSPSGWLDLEDDDIYELHAEALNDRQVQWRKQQVTSPYVDGTYTTAAVKENVSEALSIWVRAADPLELATRIAQVTDALDQLTYTLMFRSNNYVEYWTAVEPADYTINMAHELRHAFRGIVRATVYRLPELTWGAAAQEEM